MGGNAESCLDANSEAGPDMRGTLLWGAVDYGGCGSRGTTWSAFSVHASVCLLTRRACGRCAFRQDDQLGAGAQPVARVGGARRPERAQPQLLSSTFVLHGRVLQHGQGELAHAREFGSPWGARSGSGWSWLEVRRRCPVLGRSASLFGIQLTGAGWGNGSWCCVRTQHWISCCRLFRL